MSPSPGGWSPRTARRSRPKPKSRSRLFAGRLRSARHPTSSLMRPPEGCCGWMSNERAGNGCNRFGCRSCRKDFVGCGKWCGPFRLRRRPIVAETVTRERGQHVADVYDAAQDKTPSERLPFVHEASAGDSDLHRQVESLLAGDGQSGVLDTAISDAVGEVLNDNAA